MSTIFTRIIQGEVPSHKIYEDSKCQAFLDINPITKGHTLLVPREEYTWMTDTPDELISHLFIVAKQLMQQMKQHLGANHVQLHIE
jgi:histidine triad (HIT) family protein